MTTPDVNVFLVDFPTPGNEMVVPNEDGTYTILINAQLSQSGQLQAYKHALNHIKDGDFDKKNVQEIEIQAHGLETAKELSPAPVDKYEKRIRRLRRERKKIQEQMQAKEREIDFIIEMHGQDYFFDAAQYNWLYGGME